jgi:hypothetical protein
MDKTNGTRDSFCEELEYIFGKREQRKNFKPTIENENLHEMNNDSAIGVLNINEKIKPPLFATISHRVFIIHVSYYMFRLYISHLQVYHV